MPAVPATAEEPHRGRAERRRPAVQIREAVHQLAPFISFPITLNDVATINDTAAQLGPGRACLEVGNSKTAVVAALVPCFPYIGFPCAVAAVRAIKAL